MTACCSIMLTLLMQQELTVSGCVVGDSETTRLRKLPHVHHHVLKVDF
jgi:hypothetical protein